MRATEAIKELQDIGRPVIETGEAVARLDVSSAHGGWLLRSLESAGLIRRLRHGLWLLDLDADPFSIPPYLTAPFPAYVSLWSALSRHGMIEQIPARISVVSLDRPRTVDTPLGKYSIHHLAPEVFGGFEGSEETGYFATPEKALFDTAYLQAARRRAVYLPELELPEPFDASVIDDWIERIHAPWLRSKVATSTTSLLEAAA